MRACLRAVSLGTATGQQSQAWMIDERIDQGRDMAKAHLGVTCHLRCVHSPPPPLVYNKIQHHITDGRARRFNISSDVDV